MRRVLEVQFFSIGYPSDGSVGITFRFGANPKWHRFIRIWRRKTYAKSALSMGGLWSVLPTCQSDYFMTNQEIEAFNDSKLCNLLTENFLHMYWNYFKKIYAFYLVNGNSKDLAYSTESIFEHPNWLSLVASRLTSQTPLLKIKKGQKDGLSCDRNVA